MKAVVLAGGKGTRLAPYTTVLPKPLMPLGDLPILGLLLKQLKQHGVTEVILAIGHLGALIRAVVGDGHEYGVTVEYSQETEPRGTAGPLHTIIDRIDGDFLLMNGDLLTTLHLGRLIAHHQQHHAAATIAIYQRDIKIDFGLVELDADGRFKGYIEKPTYRHFVSMGLYGLNAKAAAPFVAQDRYLDMPDLILQMNGAGLPVQCYHEDCFWLDIGRPDDYRLASEIYAERPHEFAPT